MKYTSKLILNGEEYQFAAPSGGGGRQPGVNTIAYYPLKQNANDSKGTHNGTATDVTYTTISSGLGVAEFNGSTSKIDISDSLLNGLSTFTINIWIKSTDNSIFGDVLCNQSSDYTGVFIDNYYGDSRIGLGGGSTSSYQISEGVWYNISCTYDSGSFIGYVNGTQVFTDNHTYYNGTNMQIGTREQVSRYFKGSISKVIFEDKVWTAQEVANYYNQTCGDYGLQPITPWEPNVNTIAYYPLESDLNDALGNYNATYSDGTVTYGQIGGSTIDAAFFDTTKCATSLSTVANTINIWLYKPTDTNDPFPNSWKQFIGYNTSDPGDGIWLRGVDLNQSNGKFHMVVGNTFSSYDCGDVMDQWINLCCTTDGTTRKFYVNGQEVESASGDFGSSTGNLWFACIPRESGTYGRPRMYFSHIVLESSTWSAQEISDYYNQTKSLYGIS